MRRYKLKNRIEAELSKDNPNINNILIIVNDYEKDNLVTIEKLRRKRVLEIKKINGALKQTIGVHGPITMRFISSASKRIYGALLNHKKEKLIIKLLRLTGWKKTR